MRGRFASISWARSPVVVEPSACQVSSDAGLLPFRQLDEQLGLTRQFAEVLTDRRRGGYVGHTFLEMTRARIYGILADYADQNGHDVLRSDPIFKWLCGRAITCAENDLVLMVCLLHGIAATLVHRLLVSRRVLAGPSVGWSSSAKPMPKAPTAARSSPIGRERRSSPEPPQQDLPNEALAGHQRRNGHNRRREHDALGEGQPCTWRTRLIKVAARVRQTSRRVLVELSASWPYLGYFHRVAQRVLPSPAPSPPIAVDPRANSKLPASAAQSPLGGKGGGLYLVSSHPPWTQNPRRPALNP